MNCERIEELLAPYVEHDLSDEEHDTVEAHLATCARCRASLETLEALEASLGGLREAVQPWKAAELRFMRTYGLKRPWSPFAVAFSAPVLAGLSFIALGIACFIGGEALLSSTHYVIDRFVISLGGLVDSLSRGLEAFAGVNLTVLAALYGLVLIAIAGGTWFIAFRFAKR